nr:MarR family transcriptional regulator [Pantoea sp. SM3640]
MKIMNTKFNVLKIIEEKDINRTWMILDCTLATKSITGFSKVANIVTNLMNEGIVDAVYNESSSRPRYRILE